LNKLVTGFQKITPQGPPGWVVFSMAVTIVRGLAEVATWFVNPVTSSIDGSGLKPIGVVMFQTLTVALGNV